MCNESITARNVHGMHSTQSSFGRCKRVGLSSTSEARAANSNGAIQSRSPLAWSVTSMPPPTHRSWFVATAGRSRACLANLHREALPRGSPSTRDRTPRRWSLPRSRPVQRPGYPRVPWWGRLLAAPARPQTDLALRWRAHLLWWLVGLGEALFGGGPIQRQPVGAGAGLNEGELAEPSRHIGEHCGVPTGVHEAVHGIPVLPGR